MPQLLRYLEADALDVYQMDVVLALGMHRARTLAELAALRHRAFTPHTWTNGIGLLANLHVAAGVGGGPWFEVPCDPPGLDAGAPRLHAGRAAGRRRRPASWRYRSCPASASSSTRTRWTAGGGERRHSAETTRTAMR